MNDISMVVFVYQRVDSILVLSEDPPGLASTTLALVDDRAASQKKSWDVIRTQLVSLVNINGV